jgi:hypothetical protein
MITTPVVLIKNNTLIGVPLYIFKIFLCVLRSINGQYSHCKDSIYQTLHYIEIKEWEGRA